MKLSEWANSDMGCVRIMGVAHARVFRLCLLTAPETVTSQWQRAPPVARAGLPKLTLPGEEPELVIGEASAGLREGQGHPCLERIIGQKVKKSSGGSGEVPRGHWSQHEGNLAVRT